MTQSGEKEGVRIGEARSPARVCYCAPPPWCSGRGLNKVKEKVKHRWTHLIVLPVIPALREDIAKGYTQLFVLAES